LEDFAASDFDKPDFVLGESDIHVSPDSIQAHTTAIWKRFSSADVTTAAAYALCALGCDVPASFFHDQEIPWDFAAVRSPEGRRPTDWYSTPGQWMIRAVLLEHWPAVRRVVSQSLCVSLPDCVVERLARRRDALHVSL
jgi:hypothetical protein